MLDLRAAKVLVVAALAMVLLATTNFSTAAFTSSSTNTSTVRAAADWTPPKVRLGLVAPLVRGTVNVTATASDADSGVARVTIERRAVGSGQWQELCSSTSSSASCSWDTTADADGGYEVRAVATDAAQNPSTDPAAASTQVDNTRPAVQLRDPGSPLSGRQTITVTASDATSGMAGVVLQRRVSGTTTWQDACVAQVATTGGDAWTCSLDTAILQNGTYDLRAVATDKAGNSAFSVVAGRQVQNPGPTVTMTDPGAVLFGPRTLAATAASTVGVSSVELQYAASGGAGWTTLGTVSSAPYAAGWDTTKVSDGWYDVRAVATDTAGNRATSAAVTRRLVDNAGPSVTLNRPASPLTGAVPLTAVPTSLAGVRSVQFFFAPTGTTTWTSIGTATGAPYTVSWDTARVPNGSYDVRAVVTDVVDRSREVVATGHEVRNAVQAPRGVDVQAVNGGSTAGWLERGDRITYTFQDPVTTSSVWSGWTGGSQAVLVQVRDGKTAGGGDTDDVLEVLVGSQRVGLGSVTLNADFVNTNQTVGFAGTMTLGTDASGRTTVTVTLGDIAAGNAPHLRQAGAGTMTWYPAGGATATPELGPVDVDF